MYPGSYILHVASHRPSMIWGGLFWDDFSLTSSPTSSVCISIVSQVAGHAPVLSTFVHCFLDVIAWCWGFRAGFSCCVTISFGYVCTTPRANIFRFRAPFPSYLIHLIHRLAFLSLHRIGHIVPHKWCPLALCLRYFLVSYYLHLSYAEGTMRDATYRGRAC